MNEDGAGPDVGRNNDIWDCLHDGADVDTLSDGCVRVATLNDLMPNPPAASSMRRRQATTSASSTT